MDTATTTRLATATDVSPKRITDALRALKPVLDRTPGMSTVITLVKLATAYEQAQTEQDAGYMKHNREAEAMGRGRTEGIRLAVAILLELDESLATAVLDALDTRA